MKAVNYKTENLYIPLLNILAGKVYSKEEYSEEEWKIICGVFSQDPIITDCIEIREEGQGVKIVQKYES